MLPSLLSPNCVFQYFLGPGAGLHRQGAVAPFKGLEASVALAGVEYVNVKMF